MSLTVDQVAALRDLGDVWPDHDAVIIGATALGFYYEMRWRQTADVDLAVALELGDFPGALLEREGWRQHPRQEHAYPIEETAVVGRVDTAEPRYVAVKGSKNVQNSRNRRGRRGLQNVQNPRCSTRFRGF